MAKEAEKEVKIVQDYIRKLSIVSTKGPQANAPTEFVEEKADPQVSALCFSLFLLLLKLVNVSHEKLVVFNLAEEKYFCKF